MLRSQREQHGLNETVKIEEGWSARVVSLGTSPSQKVSLRQFRRLRKSSAVIRCGQLRRSRGRGARRRDALAQWQRVFDINTTGVFLSCQAEAKVMLPRKEGSIVNIASMSGTIVNRGILQVHYNASKAAVIHLTKSFAHGVVPIGNTRQCDQSRLHGDSDECPAGSRRAGKAV